MKLLSSLSQDIFLPWDIGVLRSWVTYTIGSSGSLAFNLELEF